MTKVSCLNRLSAVETRCRCMLVPLYIHCLFCQVINFFFLQCRRWSSDDMQTFLSIQAEEFGRCCSGRESFQVVSQNGGSQFHFNLRSTADQWLPSQREWSPMFTVARWWSYVPFITPPTLYCTLAVGTRNSKAVTYRTTKRGTVETRHKCHSPYSRWNYHGVYLHANTLTEGVSLSGTGPPS